VCVCGVCVCVWCVCFVCVCVWCVCTRSHVIEKATNFEVASKADFIRTVC